MRRTGWFIRAGIAAMGGTICYGIGYLFYQHPMPSGLMSLIGIAAIPAYDSFMTRRRNNMLSGHFRQFLYALSTSLAAGRSVENALIAAEKDIAGLPSTDKSEMMRALSVINGKVANGMSAEKAFAEFSECVDIADIRQFAEVFVISRISGGDIIDLIRKTANLIAEKIEIEQDIQVMTAQKSFEAKVMAIVPFALIAFLAFGSPEYMAPLYDGIGRLVMSVVLIVLSLCLWWIRSIMQIRV